MHFSCLFREVVAQTALGADLCLRADAFADGVVTTPDSLSLADGSYTADVALAGGSGRASVQSPAELTVKDGKVTASARTRALSRR